jgi:predicted small secreted protein
LSLLKFNGGAVMIQKLAAVLLVGACLAIVACNTVRGAATDVGSAANCTENAIHGGKC